LNFGLFVLAVYGYGIVVIVVVQMVKIGIYFFHVIYIFVFWFYGVGYGDTFISVFIYDFLCVVIFFEKFIVVRVGE
jgi:hypothetical protein